jgi:hypothetical protein
MPILTLASYAAACPPSSPFSEVDTAATFFVVAPFLLLLGSPVVFWLHRLRTGHVAPSWTWRRVIEVAILFAAPAAVAAWSSAPASLAQAGFVAVGFGATWLALALLSVRLLGDRMPVFAPLLAAVAPMGVALGTAALVATGIASEGLLLPLVLVGGFGLVPGLLGLALIGEAWFRGRLSRSAAIAPLG